MGFQDFYGNSQTVDRIRQMLAGDRVPHAMILAGPEGAGKYTLAQMIAKQMNCESPGKSQGLPDFCGVCQNCLRIAEADDLDARIEEALETREALREADKKDTRIMVQTHPDVLVIPPDPPQMLIKLAQVRQVIGSIYFRPQSGLRKVYIFTQSAFMKEAANSLLKILEEPPPSATILLLTTNAGELLPTIRSRCITFSLLPMQVEEVEKYLAKHNSEWAPRQRSLVARLSGGAIGRARSFDLPAYVASRQDALVMLRSAISNSRALPTQLPSAGHGDLFRVTEAYRSGAEGRDKTYTLVRTIYSLLEDLLMLKCGTPELMRNTDTRPELSALAEAIDFAWIENACRKLGQVESGMRRNLLRSVSLDAFALALER